MPKVIAILEDNAERRAAMQHLAADKFFMYPCQFFVASAPMIEWLSLHAEEAVAISLDHDLEPEDVANGWHDPGDGRQVSSYLATKAPHCPVIIHSTNVAAARGMELELTETGWVVDRITPYDDLHWVAEAWLPALRDAIVKHAECRVRS